MTYTTNLNASQKQQFESLAATIEDRYRQQSFLEADAIQSVELQGEQLILSIVMGYPANSYQAEITEQFQHLVQLEFVARVTVGFRTKIVSHSVQHNLQPLKNVKNIIAVASGKGGVGKSTVTVNLALALQAEGSRVGILDADIYGPSVPKMLNIQGRPETTDGKTMYPLKSHELYAMSIGALVDEDDPIVWRGALVTRTLIQLLEDTNWPDLDYLVIDLPPGTGDVQLTLSQQIPVTGSLVVTTPQDIAMIDAVKGLKMFEKVNIPVVGIIENMSYHICSQCGHKEAIFGAGAGLSMSDKYDVPLLESIPLDAHVREQMDKGTPVVVSSPDSEISKQYHEIAKQTSATIALKSKDYKASFPTIEIK